LLLYRNDGRTLSKEEWICLKQDATEFTVNIEDVTNNRKKFKKLCQQKMSEKKKIENC
jgi:hypothetical protein